MREGFFGNMGEPETPNEYKRKYGVYPPGYDRNGNKIRGKALAYLRSVSVSDRRLALQKYRKMLRSEQQSNVPLIINDLTGLSTIKTVDQFDTWVGDLYRLIMCVPLAGHEVVSS